MHIDPTISLDWIRTYTHIVYYYTYILTAEINDHVWVATGLYTSLDCSIEWNVQVLGSVNSPIGFDFETSTMAKYKTSRRRAKKT